MAISLNIQSTSTITYRTDCFANGYDIDYHIRDHSQYNYGSTGYLRKIAGAVGQSKTYDIGYNPSGTGSTIMENPTVCDELLCDEAYQTPTAITDVPYKELLFRKPAMALSTDFSSGADYITLLSDTFTLINRIYPKLTDKAIYCTGTDYINGSAQAYDDVFEVPTDFARIGYDRNFDEVRFAVGRSGHLGVIKSYDELLSVFDNTDHNFQAWNTLLSYTSGALCCEGNRLGSVYTVDIYGNETDLGFMRLEPYSNQSVVKYWRLIIPFVSADEYNAAKAASYKWDSETIAEIDEYVT